MAVDLIPEYECGINIWVNSSLQSSNSSKSIIVAGNASNWGFSNVLTKSRLLPFRLMLLSLYGDLLDETVFLNISTREMGGMWEAEER